MSLTVMLLVAHNWGAAPGNRSVFVAAGKTQTGTLYNNFGIAEGFNVDPTTSSIFRLGVIVYPGDDFHQRLQEIGGAVKVPERPQGAPATPFDSEAWVLRFIQALIDDAYLGQSALEKIRSARDLQLDGRPIDDF